MNTRNGVKNGKATQFSKLYQPSSNSKSEGWERRKQRQEFMDKVIKLQNISVSDFNRLRREINAKDSKYSISDLIAFKYASKVLKSDKFLLDWIERHVGKFPSEKYIEEVSDLQPIRLIIGGEDINELNETN